MLISAPVHFTYRGRRAAMFVLRNDGYCWGRLVTVGGTQKDVDPPAERDFYDDPDVDAAEAFIELIRENRGCLAPPAGSWKLTYPEEQA